MALGTRTMGHQAFLSYSHIDDQFFKGNISRLREELELAIHAVSGKPFNIFQDIDGIEFGKHWPSTLDEALKSVSFLIPILTPCYFESRYCRKEARTFLQYEEKAGRNDLVLPIYMLNAPVLEEVEKRARDPLAWRLFDRQHDDWRSLHLESGWRDPIKKRLTKLAKAISEASERVNDPDNQSIEVPDSMIRERALVRTIERLQTQNYRISKKFKSKVDDLDNHLEKSRSRSASYLVSFIIVSVLFTVSLVGYFF